eukprot:2478340-Pyramimonas_sp.AAC.1
MARGGGGGGERGGARARPPRAICQLRGPRAARRGRTSTAAGQRWPLGWAALEPRGNHFEPPPPIATPEPLRDNIGGTLGPQSGLV